MVPVGQCRNFQHPDANHPRSIGCVEWVFARYETGEEPTGDARIEELQSLVRAADVGTPGMVKFTEGLLEVLTEITTLRTRLTERDDEIALARRSIRLLNEWRTSDTFAGGCGGRVVGELINFDGSENFGDPEAAAYLAHHLQGEG